MLALLVSFVVAFPLKWDWLFEVSLRASGGIFAVGILASSYLVCFLLRDAAIRWEDPSPDRIIALELFSSSDLTRATETYFSSVISLESGHDG